MRAAIYAGAGGPEVIRFDAVAVPEVGPRQIRVRIAAAGLNRADVLQRLGQYPAPPGAPAHIGGLEYAGLVLEVAPGVTRWRVGDRVMGLVAGGAFAEQVVVHEDEALAMPNGMSAIDAAAIPEAFLTAWDALVHRGKLVAGERALIHAVASGVGTAAVQLVRLLGGTSAGTSRTAAKLERCVALGLDEPIDTRTGGFAVRLHAPVDVILDMLGASAFNENVAALAPRGRLVLVGFLAGARGDLDLAPLMRKRIEVIGTTMRPRLVPERILLAADFREHVLPHFGTALRPVVGATFSMLELGAAQQAMARDETFGKVVLVW